jgi:hypothetical protein
MFCDDGDDNVANVAIYRRKMRIPELAFVHGLLIYYDRSMVVSDGTSVTT